MTKFSVVLYSCVVLCMLPYNHNIVHSCCCNLLCCCFDRWKPDMCAVYETTKLCGSVMSY